MVFIRPPSALQIVVKQKINSRREIKAAIKIFKCCTCNEYYPPPAPLPRGPQLLSTCRLCRQYNLHYGWQLEFVFYHNTECLTGKNRIYMREVPLLKWNKNMLAFFARRAEKNNLICFTMYNTRSFAYTFSPLKCGGFFVNFAFNVHALMLL